jgi:polyphenol oxidase
VSGPFLRPQWSLDAPVHALTTLRHHPDLPGHSEGSWRGLNLGDHVGDDPERVARNRADLRQLAGLPSEPHWLRQVHGTRAVRLPSPEANPEADAAWTDQPGVVCAILTADCLPVFFADVRGDVVGLAHAGWRGLADGVLEALVAAMPVAPDRLKAWLGPAIGPRAFQVGEDVRARFLSQDAANEVAFTPDEQGRWRADLYTLARRRLRALGVVDTGGGDVCTVSDAERFYSHRRKAPCGRMASLVWRG